MKRLLLWTGGLVLVLAIAAAGPLLWARWALTAQPSCDLPCQDPGQEREIGPDGKPLNYSAGLRPRCPLVTLHLELARPVARRNTRYALWHRATLRNNSCFELGGFKVSDFILSLDDWDAHSHSTMPLETMSFRVWGPDGKEIPRQESGPDRLRRFAREWDGKTIPPQQQAPRIYLYSSDPAYKRQFEHVRLNGNWDLEGLMPGKAIQTVPSVLSPESRWPMTFRLIPRPADAETPPPGFKVLDWFIFTQPGKYLIQAVFEAPYLEARIIRPYNDRVPRRLYLLLEAFHELYGWGMTPLKASTFWSSNRYRVRAESQVLEFTVKP